MAIRIKNAKVNGKRVKNLGRVEVAKRIEAYIERTGDIEAELALFGQMVSDRGCRGVYKGEGKMERKARR